MKVECVSVPSSVVYGVFLEFKLTQGNGMTRSGSQIDTDEQQARFVNFCS
jgi:hypothetical protein